MNLEYIAKAFEKVLKSFSVDNQDKFITQEPNEKCSFLNRESVIHIRSRIKGWLFYIPVPNLSGLSWAKKQYFKLGNLII